VLQGTCSLQRDENQASTGAQYMFQDGLPASTGRKGLAPVLLIAPELVVALHLPASTGRKVGLKGRVLVGRVELQQRCKELARFNGTESKYN
jgi:hypothetical protein